MLSRRIHRHWAAKATTPVASPPRGNNTGESTVGTSSPTTSPIMEWVPTSITDDTSAYEQAVLHQISSSRPTSTRKAHDPKIEEFYEYCRSVYPLDPFCNNLDDKKVYKFMFYQSMREPRQRGGGKNRPRIGFDRADYDSILEKYRFDSTEPPPEPPDNTISEKTFAQYKQCLQKIHRDQVARRVTNLTWEQVWTLASHNLHQLVKRRVPERKKKNYHEKVDYEFAPYTVVEDFPQIETEIWVNGYGSVRSASAWLRHRYCLLQSTSGILRCESLFKAELSDLLGVVVRHDHDPHPLYVLVMQIATGK